LYFAELITGRGGESEVQIRKKCDVKFQVQKTERWEISSVPDLFRDTKPLTWVFSRNNQPQLREQTYDK
jgi:hypothetical protein